MLKRANEHDHIFDGLRFQRLAYTVMLNHGMIPMVSNSIKLKKTNTRNHSHKHRNRNSDSIDQTLFTLFQNAMYSCELSFFSISYVNWVLCSVQCHSPFLYSFIHVSIYEAKHAICMVNFAETKTVKTAKSVHFIQNFKMQEKGSSATES